MLDLNIQIAPTVPRPKAETTKRYAEKGRNSVGFELYHFCDLLIGRHFLVQFLIKPELVVAHIQQLGTPT